ncbi:ATP-binding cassette domain-containing protein [Cupriavidus metallidurans]|uniref:ATP-binding cassette domain-containing protein n=1 Tax=Cupriavidus metallidurans TaxID=119219 RepID=UPI001CC982DB|nr:ATP-binding cassette domain-containing protein [Cupriavidus metallidurans]UBM12774.1 ATP-binding cassette domain-containing protein [Cupriavidus metallidurans]
MTDSTEKYLIDVRFTTAVRRSQRVIEVAEAFGLGLDDKEFLVFDNLELDIRQGDVVYITGQSGSGKSILLRELERQMRERGKSVANLDKVTLDADLPLIDQIGTSTNDALRLLSVAGLNDAYLFVRRPGELSDGQRYRFRAAKAIESGTQAWFADEFMAVLDRTAAKVIAYSMQKVAREAGATLAVATTHTDMVQDLCPDLFIEKRYREKLRVERMTELAAELEKRPVDRQEFYDRFLQVM